ncbi:MAG: GGDEF domain-containing protein [Campylobacterales bacterium]|nr:GGDEF domain-containing protein [Campylobacterales bacterium]
MKRLLKPSTLPLFVFLVGFGFSLLVSYKTQEWIHLTEMSRLETAITHTSLLVQKRLESNIQLVRSLGGLFSGSDNVTRKDFKNFLGAHNLSQRFSGIQAVGFGPLVAPHQKQAFERASDVENFFIHPATENIAVPVYYLEPFTPHNQRALGYDMASEPIRNAAMLRALERKDVTLSSRIELLQDEEYKDGFLIYQAVFDSANVHQGYVFAAINAKRIFDGILQDRYVPIDFKLYDGTLEHKGALLYDSAPNLTNPRLSRCISLPIHGHTWALCFKADQVLDLGVSQYLPWVQLFFGSLLAFAISAWIYVLLHTRQRAFAMAEKMTYTVQDQLRVIDKNVIISSTDTRGIITDVSQAFCDVSGYTKEELIGKDHLIVRHPDTPSSTYEALWSAILQGSVWEGELKNRSKNGAAYWVHAIITPKVNGKGEVVGYTSIRQNITDKKRVEELSITDPLTGLYNRLKLDEMFKASLHVSQRHNSAFSILLLDIDRFKSVNDTHGHQVGDMVLQEFAAILRDNVRTEDIVGRWGGEEFMILTPGSDMEAATHLAEKLRTKIAHFSFSVIGHKTCSFGLSTYHVGDDEKSMVSRADDALYRAKKGGRNRVEIETSQGASTTLAPH